MNTLHTRMNRRNNPANPSRILSIVTLPLLVALGTGACAAPVDEGTIDEDVIVDEGDVGEVSLALGTTTTVGSTPAGYVAVSYSSANAYFTTLSGEFCTPAGAVQKMGLTTGAKADLVPSNCFIDPAESSSDGANLYYLEWNGDDIRRVSVSGTDDTKFVDTTGAMYHSGISVKNYRVYWADDVGIRSRSTSGGSTLTHFAGTYTDLLGVDESYIYFQRFNTSNYQHELHRGTALGTGSTVLWTQAKAFSVFTIKDNYLYWATNPSNGLSTIQRMIRTGGAATTLYEMGTNCIISMVANDTDLYWSENPNCNLLIGGGRLRRRTNPSGSGTITTQVSGLVGPDALYLRPTSSYLYWIDGGFSNRFLRRAKLISADMSCADICGGLAPSGCWCDEGCTAFGDCCPDYVPMCQ